ncbi:heterodisulfide reductase-related iron-sulfur binding cluster [Chloroflexota bacterium]
MINKKALDNIRTYGTYKDSGERRRKVLVDDIGFRIGERAKYAILTGCAQYETKSHILRALKQVMNHFQVDYTLLPKEHCCGWPSFGLPAVKAKNEESIMQARDLSREFVLNNFRQAEALGVESIVLFCAGCEPSYSNVKGETSLEVIHYAELLDRCFQGGTLELDADYFAGCYNFRRKMTSEPLDVEPALCVMNKIEGLTINHLDTKLCCVRDPELEQLIRSIKSRTVITICTGCHRKLNQALSEKENYRVLMLPEIVLEVIQSA